jgi:hypothetical protein
MLAAQRFEPCAQRDENLLERPVYSSSHRNVD